MGQALGYLVGVVVVGVILYLVFSMFPWWVWVSLLLLCICAIPAMFD